MATIGKTLFAHFRQVLHASAQYDQAITVFHRLKKRLEVSNLCSLSWDQTVAFSDLAHGLREIDVLSLRIDLFHCERLHSRGVKPENSADGALFHFFLHFSLEYEMYSRHQIGSESKEEFEEKSSNGQNKLFDQRNRLVPRGAVESLTISDWSVGGSNPSTCVNFFLLFFLCVRFESFFFFYWSHALLLTRARNNFRLKFLLNKVYDDVSVWEGEFQ